MADNITRETVEAVQTLVHDAFDNNSILDRVKTVLTTTLAFPILGNQVHMVAHRYSGEIGDGVGDLIEAYNDRDPEGIDRNEECMFKDLATGLEFVRPEAVEVPEE